KGKSTGEIKRVSYRSFPFDRKKISAYFCGGSAVSGSFRRHDTGGPERRNTVHANQVGRRLEEAAGCDRHLPHPGGRVRLGAEPGPAASTQRGRPRSNGRAT